MTFMVVNTNNYDVLLGLDFLIKIGAIVDVERGLIQVRHGLGANVEVLPLTMVNMLQRMNSKTLMLDVATALENTHLNGNSDMIIKDPFLYDPIMSRQVDAHVSDLDNDTNDNEHYDERPQLVEPNGDEYEFGNTKFKDLVLLEGPQQILQLILQGQVDDFMEEKITNIDNYSNWLKWVFDAEKRKQAIFESTSCVEMPVLLQVQKVESNGFPNNYSEQFTLSDNHEVSIRWEKIYQKM